MKKIIFGIIGIAVVISFCLIISKSNLPTALASINKSKLNESYRYYKNIDKINEQNSGLRKSIESENKEIKLLTNEEKNKIKINQKNKFVPNQVLVKFKDQNFKIKGLSGDMIKDKINVIKRNSLNEIKRIESNNIILYSFNKNLKFDDIKNSLINIPEIDYVQPNYLFDINTISTNDTYKDYLWGLDNIGQVVPNTSTKTAYPDADINASEAWATSEGNNTIVAVLDTGIAYNHPDLINNMWDGSTCVDENNISISGGCLHGYDYNDNDNNPLPVYEEHGTHVAGTIAAEKNNNKGIIGVAPQTKLMAVKIGDLTIDTTSIIKGINFAKNNGADILNMSFVSYSYDQLVKDAINNFPGIVVAAAGNESTNTEDFPSYPCNFDSSNIICVGSVNQYNRPSYFSNYGGNVHINAPGEYIYSTIPNISYPINETFDSVNAPSIPSTFTSTGNWGTYSVALNSTSMGNILMPDINHLPYLPNANSLLTSNAIDLSYIDSATLSFEAQCDTEYNTDLTDYLSIQISNDGINYNTIENIDEYYFDDDTTEGNNYGGFTFGYFNRNISNLYFTSNFKLRFKWVTNGNSNTGTQGYGCVIDNIKIKTLKNDGQEHYDYMDGTSMATPHVSGAIAILKSVYPTLNNSQIISKIIDHTKDGTLDLTSALNETVNRVNEYLVNTTIDAVDSNLNDGLCDIGNGYCSLRAAIQESNQNVDFNVITLSEGTYTLSHVGSNEENAVTGDLDIKYDLALKVGNDANAPVIDGNGTDRIFDIKENVYFVTDDITNIEFKKGYTDNYGGCFLIGKNSDVALYGNIHDCHTDTGGGAISTVQNSGADLFILSDDLSSNYTLGTGGAIYFDGDLIILMNNTFYSNNSSQKGGAIYTKTSYEDYMGGGIYIGGNNFVLNSSKEGGAIYTENLSNQYDIFEANTFNQNSNGSYSSTKAGAIYNIGKLNIISNVFKQNSSNSYGGAITNSSTGSIIIYNSTFVENHSINNGIIDNEGGIVTIDFSTFYNNSNTNVQGILTNGSTESTDFLIKNSIFKNNIPKTCYGTNFTGNNYNYISDTSCNFNANHENVLIDTVLTDNGQTGYYPIGFQSLKLQNGSISIDSVPVSECDVYLDGRGFIRAIDGNRDGTFACDAGAYEVNNFGETEYDIKISDNIGTNIYFPWYDDSDNGGYTREAYIIVVNPSKLNSNLIDVSFKGVTRYTANLQPQERRVFQINEETGGPVIVSSYCGLSFYATERVKFQDSFNEYPGINSYNMSDSYIFNWYDDSDIGYKREAWIMIGNPTNQKLYLKATLAGEPNDNPQLSINPGEVISIQWNEHSGDGPVKVNAYINEERTISDGAYIYATERVRFENSFDEYVGFSSMESASNFIFPWYDDSDNDGVVREAWIMATNINDHMITVEANIPGGEVKKVNLNPNESTSIQWNELTGRGPVNIIAYSVDNISNSEIFIATQRIRYNDKAFNENRGIDASKLSKENYFSWYDDSDLGGLIRESWILVGNPSTSSTSAYVVVKIANQVIFQGNLTPGQIVKPQWDEQVGGPVTVLSDIPVFTSERARVTAGFNEYGGI